MTEDLRPSPLLLRLLRAVSSPAAANAVVGDLLEELELRRGGGRGPHWPAIWLNALVLRAILDAILTALPRLARSSAHTVRDAARALRRAPGHALFILFILSLGISAATVTFSIVDAVVFKPLPFADPGGLVLVSGRSARGGATSLAPEEFWAVHDRVGAFESVATSRSWKAPVTVDGTTEQVQVMNAMADMFRVLELRPFIGRFWTPDEERHGDTSVTVISFETWQRRFGGDPGAIGRMLRMHDTSYRLVGVLPARAEIAGLTGWFDGDIWVPFVPDAQGTANGVSRSVFALGRLRPGETMARAQSEVQAALAPLASAKPYGYADWRPEVRGWHDAMVDSVRGWMLLVLGAVALIVLIACLNSANVMLIRSADRARELAVRAALGASRRQIAASLIVESLLLAMGAALAALLVAAWGIGAAKAALPAGIFRATTIALNARVFTASMIAALATGVLFGLAPAWQASRVSIVTLLKDAGVTATRTRRGWRTGLLVTEVACVTVLLVVSTLFVGSFVRVMITDLGVDRSHLLAVAPRSEFKGTVDEVQTRIKQVPGVIDVAIATSSSLPLVGPAFGGAYGDGKLRPIEAGALTAAVDVRLYRVTANYFAVAGQRFRRGSTWPTPSAPDLFPVVLDELAARGLFGDRDPIGLHVDAGLKTVLTVVGVVPRVHAGGAEEAARPAAYLPIAANPVRRYAQLFVRTSRDPADMIGVIETALAPIGPSGDAPYLHTVDEAIGKLTATRRFNATLMSLFAVLALVIGGAGVYSVMGSFVAQRTREIGVRLALGATARDIRHDVLAQAQRHLLIGLALGLPAAWFLSRGFSALFFQVRATDAWIYVVVAATLGLVGVLATIVPARRATRVDPIVTLRSA